MKSGLVLVTGATGFIGSVLTKSLKGSGFSVRLLLRQKSECPEDNCLFNEYSDAKALLPACCGVETVIHLAAKAHQSGISEETFRRVNTDLTIALATAAAKQGVRRFIFLSSIGVHGIKSDTPFTSTDTPKPVEEYAKSKLNAEIALRKISAETGMEVVIVRPPLVFGPDAPGNFGRLLALSKLKIPLPLGAINNQRSFVFVDNLVDLLIHCISHPNAANQIFLVSDDHNVSTSALLVSMIKAQGRKPMLIPIPVSLLQFVASVFGRRHLIDRLCDNLTVDISHTKDMLGWRPVVSFAEGIRRCFRLSSDN